MKKLVVIWLLATTLFIAVPVSAETGAKQVDCENNICFTPQITIPGTDIIAGETFEIKGDTIGRYILALYTFAVYAGGIVATIVLMAAGFVWMLAGGNTSQTQQARTMITGAVTGYVLLLFSWVLLNTINPNLTEFDPLDLPTAPSVELGAIDCTYANNKPQLIGRDSEEYIWRISTKDTCKVKGFDISDDSNNCFCKFPLNSGICCAMLATPETTQDKPYCRTPEGDTPVFCITPVQEKPNDIPCSPSYTQYIVEANKSCSTGISDLFKQMGHPPCDKCGGVKK